MFSVYDNAGVTLAYPENWRLEEESSDEARVQVSINSPDTAFWSLAIYAGLHDLRQLADQALEALRAEYPDLEPHDASETVGATELVGHDANFVCLDLTNTARIRACHHGASTVLIFCQSEDGELKAAQPVFDAITTSLFNGPPAGADSSEGV